jgi:hypothetical protein
MLARNNTQVYGFIILNCLHTVHTAAVSLEMTLMTCCVVKFRRN